jgi:5'-methylthioadenosine phosphorylase
MAFLPRHGRGHVHSPTTVPYRANIDALKRLGVTDVISVSACGSFREEMAPGDFVIVDQFIDRTFAREKSFFGTGCVAHVSVAHPTCPRLSAACLRPRGMPGSRRMTAAPTSPWRGRSSRASRNRSSTARSGAAT